MRRGLDSFLWNVLDMSGEGVTAALLWTAALVAALTLLVWAVVRVRSRFRDDDDPAAVDRAMLLGLGDLHRQGDLSESEYRSIKGQLLQRMDDSSSTGSHPTT